MKKSILTAALLVAGMVTAFAAATSQATLSLGTTKVTISEGADWTDAFDNGYDAKQYNTNGIAVLNGGERWGRWATNDLSNVQFDFGFTAAPTADVVLTVSGVIGDIFINGTKLADGGNVTLAADDFNADGSLKAGKLVVTTPLSPAAALCFQKNILVITGHVGESLVIASKEGLEIENVPSLGYNYSKDLSAYNGRYIVTLNSVAYQIDVNPAVTVVP